MDPRTNSFNTFIAVLVISNTKHGPFHCSFKGSSFQVWSYTWSLGRKRGTSTSIGTGVLCWMYLYNEERVFPKGNIYSVNTWSPETGIWSSFPVKFAASGLPYDTSTGLTFSLTFRVILILIKVTGKTSIHFNLAPWHRLANCFFKYLLVLSTFSADWRLQGVRKPHSTPKRAGIVCITSAVQCGPLPDEIPLATPNLGIISSSIFLYYFFSSVALARESFRPSWKGIYQYQKLFI